MISETNYGPFYNTACRTLESAKKLCEGFSNTKAISLDVSDDKALDEAAKQADLLISLIPYTFHAQVIKSAIRTKKHVVTTSYVSPAMLELDQQCKDAGITVMNEIGLDPVGVYYLGASEEAIRIILTFTSSLGYRPPLRRQDYPRGMLLLSSYFSPTNR